MISSPKSEHLNSLVTCRGDVSSQQVVLAFSLEFIPDLKEIENVKRTLLQKVKAKVWGLKKVPQVQQKFKTVQISKFGASVLITDIEAETPFNSLDNWNFCPLHLGFINWHFGQINVPLGRQSDLFLKAGLRK